MTTRWTTVKKLVGLAAMTTAVTAAGWGLGSGAAQAKPLPHPNPVPHISTTTVNSPFLNRVDGFLDQRAPNSFQDRFLDQVTGH
jgi:hypothetical protein